MNRWPALILVIAMVAGLVAVDRFVIDATDVAEPAALLSQARGPQSPPPDASGSTWYCPAGFVTPDASNDHVVIVSNPTAEIALGTLTLYPSLLDTCLLYTSPSPRDATLSRMPSSA